MGQRGRNVGAAVDERECHRARRRRSFALTGRALLARARALVHERRRKRKRRRPAARRGSLALGATLVPARAGALPVFPDVLPSTTVLPLGGASRAALGLVPGLAPAAIGDPRAFPPHVAQRAAEPALQRVRERGDRNSGMNVEEG